MANIKEIKGKEFRRMQLIQNDMLIEFDRVCRENDINYVIISGTLLGAVRHKGYIPWDDDADIGMLREDYEKFKIIAHKLDPSICYFQDHTTDPEYRWGYGKLRRTGTTFVRAGQEHLKFKTGVFVDVFPFDDVPNNLLLQMFLDFYLYCMRKILWSEVARVNEKGFMKAWYSLINHIPVEFVFKSVEKFIEKSSNSTPNRVRILLLPSMGKEFKINPLPIRYSMPKKWLLERAEYEFEGEKLYGIKDYDDFLFYAYGDYMSLPPENERIVHAPVSSYDFGGIWADVHNNGSDEVC